MPPDCRTRRPPPAGRSSKRWRRRRLRAGSLRGLGARPAAVAAAEVAAGLLPSTTRCWLQDEGGNSAPLGREGTGPPPGREALWSASRSIPVREAVSLMLLTTPLAVVLVVLLLLVLVLVLIP